jgi:tetratricopeptide (TPR) repeat protein
MTEQAKEVERIFLAALDRATPGERSVYVEGACAGNLKLLQRVRQLLDAHEEAQGPLDAPSPSFAGTVDHPGITEGVGTVLGPYRLLQPIGEGGMGTVFMAEQTQPVERKVGLKIIKPGMDSRQVVARFEAERQALALMDHPNIARILDADTTASGRPFFVMELVKGVPMTRYCDEHRLTPRQRLELFVPVCQAVQHAHQKGIIHRDLKPSNVLVAEYDDRPVAKVIDFGVAKAAGPKLTERTLFTEFGAVVGTLEYMSPEQAKLNALDIDTRSDIYALGVLLYELLTGTTPFDRKRLSQAAFDEMLRIIREEEPPRPSTRLSTTEELPTIAANHGMEPKQLSSLVRGELDWIVMKCLEKDRNRRYETANALALDVQRYLHDEPVQACPPSGWYRFRKFARRNKQALLTASVIALATLVAVGGLAGSIGWVVRDRTAQREAREGEAGFSLRQAAQLLEQGNPSEATAWARRAELVLAGAEAPAVLQRRLGEVRADLDMVARLEQIRIGQSAVEQEHFAVAEADPKYAQAFRDYGIDVEALQTDRAAEHIRGRSIRLELAGALDDWAHVRRQRKPRDPSWRHLNAVAAAADPDEQRNRLRKAWEQNDRQALEKLAGSSGLTSQPPMTLALLGNALRRSGSTQLAVTLLRKAQLRYPNAFWINEGLGFCLMELRPPRWQEALPYYHAALALRPTSPGVLLNLANALSDKGDHEGCISLLNEALRLKPDFAMAWSNRGKEYWIMRQWDKALADCARAIELKPGLAMAWYNRGNTYSSLRQWDKALADYTKAVELEPDYADAWHNRGATFHSLGRQDKALADYAKAIELKPGLAMAWYNRGNTYSSLRQWDKALADYTRAVELEPDYANAWHNRGNTYLQLRLFDKALADYTKAIELKPNLADSWYNRGNTCQDLRRWDRAVADYTRAVELQPDFAEAWTNRGNTYLQLRQFDKALADYTKAIELKPDLTEAWIGRGLAHRNLGQCDKALADYTRAIELKPGVAIAWNNRGTAYHSLRQWDKALADYTAATKLQPGYSTAWNNLARLLASCPQENLRDPPRAVEAAKKAIALDSKQGRYWNTLGMAHYRAGDWRAAVAALEKSMALSNGGDSFDWFLLAMAHGRLDQKDQARKRYDEAVRWMEKHEPENEKLRRFRSEAAELLGLEQEKD